MKPTNFIEVVNLFLGLINSLIPVILGLSLLVFVVGIVKFMRNAGDSASHQDGKNFMVWSLVALFVAFSVWGILSFAYKEAGFSGSIGIPFLPENK